ncbi:MAG: transglutaminase-like cysteine peptidase [Campylobacterales bacterium]|nr:transglutaminase-like cysteine peptidase [Campylobacterales bacterium]
MFFFRYFFIIASTVIITSANSDYVDTELISEIEKKYDIYAKKRFFYQQQMLDSIKDATDEKKLDAVNSFYNDVKYQSDKKNYGVSDYWATPYEFLARDSGDCEDYVIAKYFALKHLGVDEKKMFFFYVKSTKFTESHMVLAYYKKPSSIPLILDNYNLKVLPANKRDDLKPIFRLQAGAIEKVSTGEKVVSQKVGRKWDLLIQNIQRRVI